jgi:HAMP domain-containing protein
MIRNIAPSLWKIIALIALLAPAGQARAGDPMRSIVRDSRILRDILRLRLDAADREGDPTSLVLARIRVADPAGASDRFGDEACKVTVNVTAVLRGKFATKEWSFSQHIDAYRSGPDGLGILLEPYQTPGEAVAILRVAADGDKVKIVDTFLLPPEWADDVEEANRFMTAHRDLFQNRAANATPGALIDLLHGKNSLLAVAGARALAADFSNVTQIMKEIKASKGIRQAGITLALLQTAKAPKNRLGDLAGEFNELIQQAQKPIDLHGIALAAYRAGEWGERTADDVLTGETDSSSLDRLSAAERLQPILIRNVRDVYVEIDPNYSDSYVAWLVGLGVVKSK